MATKNEFTVELNKDSTVKKTVAAVSGKGGVGKSLVTSLLAVTMNRKGQRTAILDADLTGPSIPKAFGLNKKPPSGQEGIHPVQSKTGIGIMSINLLLAKETDPVVWRGPILASTVKQFWTDVVWGDVDYMFIDLPPGTGDVPLTVFQSIPIDGIVIVTSPQQLVSTIVAKAVNMAEMMKIPIIGMVENMSYFRCPGCDREYDIFGHSHIDEIARRHKLPVLGKLPIEPKIAAACDNGTIEDLEGDWLEGVAEKI